jgi:hypothetical protein
VFWTHDVMRLEHLENAPETIQATAFFGFGCSRLWRSVE